MTIQRVLVLSFALATLGFGVMAAVYWWRSSALDVPLLPAPDASISDAPEQHHLTTSVNLDALFMAGLEAAALNRTAAGLTAIAALLGAITTVIGAF
ncbi:MAG: hypothetical protein V4587_11975 [Acidobacteriota bacterium]